MTSAVPPAVRHDNAGRKPRRASRFHEVIGSPDCPIMDRWTILGDPTWPGHWPVKLMVHRFRPGRSDAHDHDHPRPFVTVVLAGCYDDMRACEHCDGDGVTGRWVRGIKTGMLCSRCAGLGKVMQDHLRAWSIRFRPAAYAHTTRTDSRGAWTLVVMGPKVREWGFWRSGFFWPWRLYEEAFGMAFRCEDG